MKSMIYAQLKMRRQLKRSKGSLNVALIAVHFRALEISIRPQLDHKRGVQNVTLFLLVCHFNILSRRACFRCLWKLTVVRFVGETYPHGNGQNFIISGFRGKSLLKYIHLELTGQFILHRRSLESNRFPQRLRFSGSPITTHGHSFEEMGCTSH